MWREFRDRIIDLLFNRHLSEFHGADYEFCGDSWCKFGVWFEEASGFNADYWM